MQVLPSAMRLLAVTAFTALFVAAPDALKFDASGISVAGGAAFAQTLPDPIGPPDGPIEGPECGVDCGPPEGPIDPPECGVDCVPIDPPECGVDCVPIDPPECEVDCDPVEPPVECEVDCEPVKSPVVAPQPSDDDDSTPPPPVVDETPVDPKADAKEFLQNLDCPDEVACVRTVTEDGDMEVTMTGDGPGETTVTTTVSVVDTTVAVEVTSTSGPTASFDDVEFDSRDEAEDAVTGVVELVVRFQTEFDEGIIGLDLPDSFISQYAGSIALSIGVTRVPLLVVTSG